MDDDMFTQIANVIVEQLDKQGIALDADSPEINVALITSKIIERIKQGE